MLYPRKVVVGFDRVALEPGETERVDIRASILPLATVLGDVFARGELVVDTGEYWFAVGEVTESLSVI